LDSLEVSALISGLSFVWIEDGEREKERKRERD